MRFLRSVRYLNKTHVKYDFSLVLALLLGFFFTQCISSDKEDYFVEKIINAGSVFIGEYTPESAGDYASGTNHTLPTNGYASSYSGVSVDSFVKKITYQKITSEGLKKLGPSIEIMAEAEELAGHKNAVSVRLKTL